MKTRIFILVFATFFLAFLDKSHGQDTLKNEFNLSIFAGAYFPTPNFEPEFTSPISVNLLTKKTHHHLQLDPLNGGSIITINGAYLSEKWDAYHYFSKYINTPGGYTSIGVEKYFEIGEAGCLVFGELGTD